LLAAAIWAKEYIEKNPESQIAIVVPDMASNGDMIHDALQDILAPETLYPSQAEAPMPFNLSLGRSLEKYPFVATAIDLLDLIVSSHEIEQSQFSFLLRSPYWSAGLSESCQRASIEAGLRTIQAPRASLIEFVGVVEPLSKKMGDSAKYLLLHLRAMKEAAGAMTKKALPSVWSTRFVEILAKVGWHHERPLSSHEFQTKRALQGELERLATLDPILGEIRAVDALARLKDLCGERVFQPKTEGSPRIQVLGLLEASGLQFDAIRVTGMIDTAWPPSANPNPLLPAEAQRRALSPNSCAAVQLEFANNLQERLIQSAGEVLFHGRELKVVSNLGEVL